MNAPRHAQSGFTLLEVVVSLALLGLITATLMPSLRFGSKAWDTGHQRLEETARLRTIQDFLGRVLAEAQPIFLVGSDGEREIAFRGQAASLTLVAPMPPHLSLGAYHVLQLDVAKASEGKALIAHWDQFRDQTDDLGLSAGTRHVTLIAGIAGIEFSYFGVQNGNGRPEWSDSWADSSSLPQLIRMRVLFDRKSGREWPAMVFRPMSGGSAFVRT
jgi:general secretion pathway protein J